jgi:hypothetical protein
LRGVLTVISPVFLLGIVTLWSIGGVILTRETEILLKKNHSNFITLSFLRGMNEISALLVIY